MRVFAYIDPSTGSFALQAAVGAVLGASYIVRNRVKLFLSKFKKGDQTEKLSKD